MLKSKKGREIIKKWEDISKREGTNVSKNFIYGDRLYEELFSNPTYKPKSSMFGALKGLSKKFQREKL